MRQIREKSILISICSPFFVTLKDGIDQLFEVLQDEDFIFIVKDQEFKMTVAEAVSISSKVHKNLRSAPEHHQFEIEGENITMKDFVPFVDFVHSDVCDKF
jgi:hypothetical protein